VCAGGTFSMVRLQSKLCLACLVLLVCGSVSVSSQLDSVASDSSRPRVQFVCGMNMTEVLNEGRMLFQLRVPTFVEGPFYKNISLAAGVGESSIDVFDVQSDGESLFIYTRVVFVTLRDAERFLDALLADPRQVLPSIQVIVVPASIRLLRPGQDPPAIKFPVPWPDYSAEEIPGSQLAAKPAAKYEDAYQMPATGNMDPAAASADEGAAPNQPMPAWLMAALALAVVGTIVLVVASFVAYRQARRGALGPPGTNEVPTMIHGNDEFEPMDVQCIDTAIVSRNPTADNDLRPPNPPTAPPAGIEV